MLNQFVHGSLTDLLIRPDYSDDLLLNLRSNLAANQEVGDNLEYFLFSQIGLLRRQAALAQEPNIQVMLHHKADALVSVLNVLFGKHEVSPVAKQAPRL